MTRILHIREFGVKVDKTLRYHGREAVRAWRGAWWDRMRMPADRPVIVVGCPRAGTTVTYMTLSQSRELGTLQRETHDFWMDLHPLRKRNWDTHALEAADARARDRDHVTRHFYAWTGRRRWVDKNNQNSLAVPYLRALFPDAAFVYVKRNPGDNLNSLIEGWARPDKYATWSDGPPAEVRVDGGAYTRWCFFLADGWREYVDAPVEEVAAFQYEVLNRAILDAKAEVPADQWIEVLYEDLVRDPVACFRTVFSSCDLPFDDRMEAHCRDLLSRPYDAFGQIRVGKWQNGRNCERIQRILPRVHSIAQRMGYDG